MRTLYIRELTVCTVGSFAQLLDIDDGKSAQYIEMLCARDVLRAHRDNQADVPDGSRNNQSHLKYKFDYVGLALVDKFCLIVYPKYLPFLDNSSQSDEDLQRSMRQIFRVLRRYGRGQLGVTTADESVSTENSIAIILMLLEMYGEYGVYTNYVKALADNGTGEINWERTIASKLPYFANGRPICFDYKTVVNNQDSTDFVMRLHRATLTECSDFMQQTGLATVLGIDEVWLTSETVEDFGDTDYVIYRLEQERATQFVTWKQDVIDLLIQYVRNGTSATWQESPFFLGKSDFEQVWEAACKVAFNDVLDERLIEIEPALDEEFIEEKNTKLIDIVPWPQWSVPVYDGDSCMEKDCEKVSTLRPDTVLIHRDAVGNSTFVILDAKYRTPQFDDKVTGQPGVEEVTKQFLYQSAYREFILAHKYQRVFNAFLIPSAENETRHVARVRFPGVIAVEEPPFTNVVETYALPAEMIFAAYLRGSSLDNKELLAVLLGD